MGWIEQKEVVLNWISSLRYGEFILNKYSYAALIFFSFIVLSFLVRYLYKTVFFNIAKRTRTDIDNNILKATKWPISIIIIIFGLRVGVIPLSLSERLTEIIYNLVDSIVIFIIAALLTSIINILVEAWGRRFGEKTESETDIHLLSIFHRFVKVLFFILAFLFVLERWGVEIGPLLASLGIAGIAVGFAVKDSLANIFGGIQLIMDKTFKAGDKIELADGTVGVVQDISLRSTRIRTYDNELIIVPNGKFSNENIKNHVQPDLKVRVRVPFGVVYGSDIKKVKKVVLKAIKTIDGIMDEPAPDVLFLEMADFSLNFRAQFWVPSYTQKFMSNIKANELIYDALNKAGIGIPFPTRTLYVHNLNDNKNNKKDNKNKKKTDKK